MLKPVLEDVSAYPDDEVSDPLPPYSRERTLLTAQALTAARQRDTLSGEALVIRAEIRSDRNGYPYVALRLRSGDGELIEARWWRFPSGGECPVQGMVYWFDGTVDSFNGERQLCVTSAHGVPDPDMSPFTKCTRRSEAELVADLEAMISTLDAELTALVWAVLSGETYARFRVWPAAQVRHGAVRHGLLAHSLRVAQLAEYIAACYGPDALTYDRSVVIAAALLHDIGKVRTLPSLAGIALPDAARRFDHVTLSALMMQEAAMTLEGPLDPERYDALAHALLAHHGRKEWGASIEPQTVEAWLVHLADFIESRLWQYTDEVGE